MNCCIHDDILCSGRYLLFFYFFVGGADWGLAGENEPVGSGKSLARHVWFEIII